MANSASLQRVEAFVQEVGVRATMFHFLILSDNVPRTGRDRVVSSCLVVVQLDSWPWTCTGHDQGPWCIIGQSTDSAFARGSLETSSWLPDPERSAALHSHGHGLALLPRAMALFQIIHWGLVPHGPRARAAHCHRTCILRHEGRHEALEYRKTCSAHTTGTALARARAHRTTEIDVHIHC